VHSVIRRSLIAAGREYGFRTRETFARVQRDVQNAVAAGGAFVAIPAFNGQASATELLVTPGLALRFEERVLPEPGRSDRATAVREEATAQMMLGVAVEY
jgi:hypothetical protein